LLFRGIKDPARQPRGGQQFMNVLNMNYEAGANAKLASADERKTLRVVLLTRSLTMGGAQRQLIYLARGLAARGHDVHVLTFYGGGELHGTVADPAVRVSDLGKSGRWDLLPFAKKARSRLADLRPDVIYSFLTPANLTAAGLRRFLPAHRLVWSVRASNLDYSDYGSMIGLTMAVERRLSNIPDLIVANSESGRRDAVARGFPAAKTCVVPNGIDTEALALTTPDARARARASLGLQSDESAIGTIARLDPMKDHPTFLRALAQVAAERRVRGVLAGPSEGVSRTQLEALAAELGIADRLLWLGPVAQVADLYPALDVVCLSSAYGEGLPNVIGEAMACGIPCVATDVGDCRILLDGLGSVVAPGSPGALAQAMLSAIDARIRDPELPQRLRARILGRYSLTRMVESTEAHLYGWRAA
jgi:glycosyltransferase involved in cell wall biosynthesis